MQLQSWIRPLFNRQIRLGIVIVAVCSLAGCGLEEYERRLAATQSYYAYHERLDQNLSTPWKTPPIDVLRVPAQFTEIPAPQPVEGPDGKPELPAADPRQPDYSSLTIYGLIGAWRAQVDVTVGDKRESKPVYLYAATNYEQLLSDKEAALNFIPTLVAELESRLETTGRKEADAIFPKGHQFTPKQSFENYLFPSDLAIHDVRYVFELYAIRQTENQVAIVIARPEGMDPQAKVTDRIQLMLETMKVSAAAPQPRQQGQPGGAPSGPAPNVGNF